jgi:hypothetical protein
MRRQADWPAGTPPSEGDPRETALSSWGRLLAAEAAVAMRGVLDQHLVVMSEYGDGQG